MSVDKSITIIGCGWLGLPLAKRLLKHGWKVRGTTTSESKIDELMALGIEPFRVHLPTTSQLQTALFDSDFMIIDFPPGRKQEEKLKKYNLSIKQLIDNIEIYNRLQRLIFISSTSVYGSITDPIDESSPTYAESESGRVIKEAEKRIVNSGFQYIILRFGGLAGPGRHPGRFLSGKKEIPNANQSVNLLHLEDAIGVIVKMLNSDIANEILNVVAPIHPSKKEYYTRMSKDINLVPPTFKETSEISKREVSVDKLQKLTDYIFEYPDPMTFRF